MSLIGMHFVWSNCIDSWSKRDGKFDKDFVRQFIACPFWPCITYGSPLPLTPSLSLPLSLSLTLYVCAASCGLCLGVATLFNGKKFTLPLASRKLCPRTGKAYVVVPLAPLLL